MNVLHVVVLAVVQGVAELLPVSSSAHAIVAEKLMGLNPTSPDMTLLLVMLHTGTMFAVIAYFWQACAKRTLRQQAPFGRMGCMWRLRRWLPAQSVWCCCK